MRSITGHNPGKHSNFFVLSLLYLLFSNAAAAPVESDFPWQKWGPEVFKQAKQEKKFVLLSLQAWWCHPCHQMNTITYDDSAVRDKIQEKFIPVYIDQDSRPDISQRFERWGWPATIIFDADGTEIVKLKGFYSPKFFIPILQATIDDPSPVNYGQFTGDERPTSQVVQLNDEQRAVIVNFMNKMYDNKHGGWGRNSKFVHGPTFNYALEQTAINQFDVNRAKQTIDGLIAMIDKHSGGVSQISLGMDWDDGLEEYPMFAQLAGLEAFSLAYSLWKEPKYLEAAEKVSLFLRNTMSAPDGGFYTSTGSHNFNPGIDQKRYSRENGQAILALTYFYYANADNDLLGFIESQARWVLKNRGFPGGGFQHDKNDLNGPFLSDSLSMAKALLALYQATGNRAWLNHSKQTADFIAQNFIDNETGGFLAAAQPSGSFMQKAVKNKDDNVSATRFFNRLFYYTGQDSYAEIARNGMGYLTSNHVLDAFWFLPGVLQAEYELNNQPVHITIVGDKNNSEAAKLHHAALRYPTTYKRAEWWDKNEGPLLNDDVSYPQMSRAAAFACSDRVCSKPAFNEEQLTQAIKSLYH